jgi:hypothetical protein
MTAKEVSVGLTYNVKFADNTDPVTLTRECEWGGWYGRNERTGATVRIATAGRLHGQVNGTEARAEARKQDSTDNIVTTQSKESPAMPTTTPAQRNARSSRRTKPAAKPAATPAPEATESVLDMARRVDAEVTAAKAKPKAAPRRRGNVKLSGTVTEEAAAITLTQAQLDAMVADAVAKALGETPAPKPTAKRTAKPKSTVKPLVITLAPTAPKQGSYQFKYDGKDANPLVTAVYLMIPLLERFAEDGTPVEIAFKPYQPVGKQAPMPKSKIRYTGSEDTIKDLYVDRALITEMGYSETNPPTVTVQVIKGNKITLTFLPA